MIKQIKITQRKEECHYETTFWDNRHRGGWWPFVCGYGRSQEEADTNALEKWKTNQIKQ